MFRLSMLAATVAATLASATVTVAALSTSSAPSANQMVGRAFGTLAIRPAPTRELRDALGMIGRDRVPTLRIDRAVRAA